MDLRLPILADANLHLGVAEEAFAVGSLDTARSQLEKSQAALEELYNSWPEISDSEKGLIQAMIKPMQDRISSLEKSLRKTPVV